MKTVYWTFPDIEEKSRQLGLHIQDSGFVPDLVVGIKFGGHLVGQRVAAVLQVPYTSLQITRRQPRVASWIPHMGRWCQVAYRLIEDVYYRYAQPILVEPLAIRVWPEQTVLLVDDDVVLSKTVNLAKAHVIARGADPSRIRVAALAIHPDLVVKPDYFLDVADVVFPWSVTSPHYTPVTDAGIYVSVR